MGMLSVCLAFLRRNSHLPSIAAKTPKVNAPMTPPTIAPGCGVPEVSTREGEVVDTDVTVSVGLLDSVSNDSLYVM